MNSGTVLQYNVTLLYQTIFLIVLYTLWHFPLEEKEQVWCGQHKSPSWCFQTRKGGPNRASRNEGSGQKVWSTRVSELYHATNQFSLRCRHNERDGVSNHQPHDCLLDRLFRHRWKITSKLQRWPVNSPHKGPVTRKMIPFDDIIMWY